ncbi:endonuclease/exonuclease/phosphatase family protein [Inediibacterium massiliense]|uniref:endonuclease/exonuclease/phosphatase family protein n=1 Tax=Inediibacterium massiliense TaxID=1658111 RepID=UPI0006B4EA74|nr:endonuclease/exonuclease/phosphatase family protein [Inediibacterium massiliense]
MAQDKYILKILTYNIHSGKDLFMIPKLNQLMDFLKNEKFHIMALQEINENNKRGYQVSTIYKNLLCNHAFSPNVKIGDGYYGVATFSFFKILNQKHIPLPSKKEQRGMIHTLLKIGNKKLNILNIHLGLNAKEREKQLSYIEKYIKTLNDPFILLGDFNTSNPKLNIPMIDAATKFHKEDLSTLMPLNKRIDYIFLSPSIELMNYHVFPVKFSDHYPVCAEILI